MKITRKITGVKAFSPARTDDGFPVYEQTAYVFETNAAWDVMVERFKQLWDDGHFHLGDYCFDFESDLQFGSGVGNQYSVEIVGDKPNVVKIFLVNEPQGDDRLDGQHEHWYSAHPQQWIEALTAVKHFFGINERNTK